MFEKEDPTRQGTAGVAEVDHPGGSIASPDKASISAGQSAGQSSEHTEGRAGNARWVYDGRDLCGRVEVIDSLFIAIDVDEKVIGRFKTLRQATRALPAGEAP